jgi:hypothetical protein
VSPPSHYAAREGPLNPLVAAISPLTETQTLDLASSQRQVIELSIALSAALRMQGLAGQAEVVEQYVDSLQHDVRTRNAVGVANSYSASGGVFGYQVGPELRGLADPAEGDEAGDVLDRQSFPVLIVIGFDQPDLRPRLEWKSEGGSNRLRVLEPKLRIYQTSRWIPLERPWYSLGGRFGPRLSETERLAWSHELASESTNRAVEGLRDGARSLYELRRDILKHFAFGSGMQQDLPLELIFPGAAQKPKLPRPEAVIPGEVALSTGAKGAAQAKRVRLVITGLDLDSVVGSRIGVATGDAELDSQATEFVGGALLLTLDVTGASSPIVLRLPIDPARANVPDLPANSAVLAPAIAVRVEKNP